jgi:hypothetical protein
MPPRCRFWYTEEPVNNRNGGALPPPPLFLPSPPASPGVPQTTHSLAQAARYIADEVMANVPRSRDQDEGEETPSQ